MHAFGKSDLFSHHECLKHSQPLRMDVVCVAGAASVCLLHRRKYRKRRLPGILRVVHSQATFN